MILWISLAAAVIAGSLGPLGERLQATGLWLGKSLVAPDAQIAQPRGLQDAVIDGWPSTIGFILGASPFLVAALSLLHAWWAPLIVFTAYGVTHVAVGRTRMTPRALEWYLHLYLNHALRRQAEHSAKGDVLRADAAQGLARLILDVYSIYEGTGIGAPNMNTAKAAAFGSPASMLAQDLDERPS